MAIRAEAIPVRLVSLVVVQTIGSLKRGDVEVSSFREGEDASLGMHCARDAETPSCPAVRMTPTSSFLSGRADMQQYMYQKREGLIHCPMHALVQKAGANQCDLYSAESLSKSLSRKGIPKVTGKMDQGCLPAVPAPTVSEEHCDLAGLAFKSSVSVYRAICRLA